jgi:hypothetical protein
MKRLNAVRIVGFVVCCFLLAALLAGVALAQPIGQHQVAGGTISGAGYHLMPAYWQVSGTAGGGGYRLMGPPALGVAGSGCCCTYLPCVMSH